MEKDFWLSRWQNNEIGFHNVEPHRYLLRFFALLRTQQAATVFVPLCGKSPDLIWLHEQGLNVIGVELSRMAIDAFFDENGLNGEWTHHAEKLCRCVDGYQLFCDDFFRLTTDDLNCARAVYDRGSLVALPLEMRSRYAIHLTSLLPPGSRVLLVSYEYDQIETFGPPFSVALEEIKTLFSAGFQIELLAAEDVLKSHQGLIARGVTRLTELAVLLVRS